MKPIVNSIIVRLSLTAAVFTALVICPQLSVSPSVAAATDEPKTEAQFKAEAARYESAIRAIGGIASQNLGTPDALKSAIAIVDRERPNLDFFKSKLVVLGLADSTFKNAVRKEAATEKAAEALLNNLVADPATVYKLDGAESLKTRLQQSLEADAVQLRNAAEHLKAAAAKIKQSGSTRGSEVWQGDRATFVLTNFSDSSALANGSASASSIPLDPVTIATTVAIIAGVIVVAVFVTTAIVNLYRNLFLKKGRDRVADCRKDADDRLATCLAAANRLPFPFNLSAIAECEAQWLLAQGECFVTTN